MSQHGFESISSEPAEGGGAQYYKGMFGSLKFPKFRYQEYPKHVKDLAGRLLGVAENALEEGQILDRHGLEHKDVDPVAHLTSENEALKAKLAQYEGGKGVEQIAAKSQKATQTVEMLPETAGHSTMAAEPTGPTVVPASVSGNPLLKDKIQPVANAQGPAPQVTKPISAGV